MVFSFAVKKWQSLEQVIRRLKKRTRVVCVFPNRASCDRLIGAQLLEVHEGWMNDRNTTFNMESAAGAAV